MSVIYLWQSRDGLNSSTESYFENYVFDSSINQYRCEDAEAFEVQDGGKSTGIFTKYLNKHILQSEKVTHVLEKVSEGRLVPAML